MDLAEFRTNVENLVQGQKQPSDEDFHKFVIGWANDVTLTKAKDAIDEVANQVKGGVHKLIEYVNRHHNK